MRDGLDAAQLLRKIEAATQRFWKALDAESRYENITLKGDKLRITRKRHARRGAPKKEAARVYVSELLAIYEAASGQDIKRNVDRDNGTEHRHPFLAICMKAAGTSYPPRLVREVLEKKK